MGDPDDPDDEATRRTRIAPAAPPPARTVVAPTRRAVDVEPQAPAREAFAPGSSPSGQVEPGDELNGIYRIIRRVGAGGMGEVFEGLNIEHGQQRVAIKVMLPSLAADPEIQKSFRREADVLLGLSHPALVKYMFMAREPRLGVLYMVTEFIDGGSLEELVGSDLDAEQLIALTRRLAEGLKAAHEAGVDAHRDMSPDNVLLPGGRMEEAKIVDFGIAKSADPKKDTIVGQGGFAGKLGFAAPEQFGEYGGLIGPWTDVYSLGLVILTLALGKSFSMGATLAEAVQRRQGVPDLSGAPEEIRDVLQRMLAPDPAQRARSMDEVLELLPRGGERRSPRRGDGLAWPSAAPPNSRARIFWYAGAAGVAAFLLVVGMILVLRHASPAPQSAAPDATPPAIAQAGPANGGASASPAALQSAVLSALNRLPCTWVTLAGAPVSVGANSISLQGVTQHAMDIQETATRAAPQASIDSRLVSTVLDPRFCDQIDAFRELADTRETVEPRITSAQPSYIESQKDGGLPLIKIALRPEDKDFGVIIFDQGTGLYLTSQDLATLGDKQPKYYTHPDQSHYTMQYGAPEGLNGAILLVSSRDAVPDYSHYFRKIGPPKASWSVIAQDAKAAGLKADVAWFTVTRP